MTAHLRPADMRCGYSAIAEGRRTTVSAQGHLPQRRYPANALRHVLAGQRRTGNVFDISPEPQLLEARTPIKLIPPGVPTNFASVALPVREDLQWPHAAGEIDTDGIGDHVLSSEDFIDEHVTQQIAAVQGLPGAQRPMRRLRAGQ